MYLCLPVRGWPSYSPRNRVPFSSPFTTHWYSGGGIPTSFHNFMPVSHELWPPGLTGFLDFVHHSHRFRKCICFLPQVKSLEYTYWVAFLYESGSTAGQPKSVKSMQEPILGFYINTTVQSSHYYHQGMAGPTNVRSTNARYPFMHTNSINNDDQRPSVTLSNCQQLWTISNTTHAVFWNYRIIKVHL